MALKNIIFDLGGVLLDIDYNKTADAFKALGYSDFDRMYSQFTADDLFAALETGKISEGDFLQTLSGKGPEGIHNDDLAFAWNKMLLVWRTGSLNFLKTLPARYNIYLLSNTNTIHLTAFNAMLKEQTGEQSINPLFTKTYYSNEIGLRKPGKTIFEFVLADAGLRAEETLFIDDSENNIGTAAAMGFRTHLLQPGENIETLNYGNL